LRMPLVLVNAATVWLMLQFQRFMPRRACIVAALAFAVSPGMVFYSRYSIHEAWFVFGMVLGVWGLAEMWTRGTARGLWALVLGVTLLMLTKETFILHFAAFGLAAGTLALLESFSPSAPSLPDRPVPQLWSRETLGNAVAVALLLIVFFYSGGFLDPERDYIQRFFQAFVAWSHTGVKGNGHEKPFYYWLQLLGQYEWPGLLGLLYCARAVWPGMNRLTRFLAIYGCGALVAYGIVPYKTPWCIISILWPFLFLFGEAVDFLATWAEREREQAARPPFPFCSSSQLRWAIGLLTTGVLGVSLGMTVRLNYYHPTDATERYVYVQTLDDLFKLTRRLDRLVELDPTARHMPANILLSSYHPLPWVLGDFTSIGYYDKPKVLPPTMDAGFLLVEADRVEVAEAHLQQRYFVEPFHLRDAMDAGKLYLSHERFKSLFPGRKPEFDPLAPVISDDASVLPESTKPDDAPPSPKP